MCQRCVVTIGKLHNSLDFQTLRSAGRWPNWSRRLRMTWNQTRICFSIKFHFQRIFSNRCKGIFKMNNKKVLCNRILFRILHFAQHHDIQTAAMLCCAFGRHCPPNELSRSSSLSSKSIIHSVSYSTSILLHHIHIPIEVNLCNIL